MSIKAVFYILNDSTLKARDLYACRLIEKAYHNARKVFVNVEDSKQAQDFYAQLWTFHDTSFIPHEIYNTNPEATVPVLIGFKAFPPNHNDILVNLTNSAPTFYAEFQHIIEIVPNDATLKTMGRQRYQFYQKAGCTIETHNIL